MAKLVRFTPQKTESGWRLNVPAKYSQSGKRERHFFRTHKLATEAALKFKGEVETFGVQARAIRPALAEQAAAAEELLKPWGISILDAASIVRGIKLREEASKPLNDAVDLWIESTLGLRTSTKRNYRGTAKKLKAAFGDKLLVNIAAVDIQEVIAPKGTSFPTADERFRNTRAFWFWCARKKWCERGVISEIDLPKREDSDEIRILTTSEAEDLLHVAEKYFPDAVAAIAVQLYAGIRVEEIQKLDADQIVVDGIEVGKGVAKKKRRRHITPSPSLVAWLTKYPYARCANWREKFIAIRRISGWKVESRILTDRVKAGKLDTLPVTTRGPWPQNAMRHSHASYSVASGMRLERLLFEFGHSGGVDLLKTHYVGRATRAAAKEYFAIRPSV